MIKSFVLSILFTGLLLSCEAQTKTKWQPFSDMSDISLFGEVNSNYLTIDEQRVFNLGVKGGVVWNPNNAIGFTFSSSVNKFSPRFESDKAVFLRNVLTGLFYEYMWKPNELIHVTFPIAIGVGESYYDWRELDQLGRASFPYEEVYYLYLEPSARVEFNLSPKCRLFSGVTYILAPIEFDYRGVTNGLVSRPSFQLGIRYGRFFWQ